MIRIGSSSARRTISMPVFSSSSAPLTLSSAFWHHRSEMPPPGTMPSSTAARVACSASSTRDFFSFISVSVAAPTLITARSEEHTSELQSPCNLVCRLLLEKKKTLARPAPYHPPVLPPYQLLRAY